MTAREALHRLVDHLPEHDLPVAARVLEALNDTANPVSQALLRAPMDDEPDDDNFDGGLTQAREEAAQSQLLSHDEVKRELGLA